MDFKFKIGDKVKTVSGYRWPGVVECTVPEVCGALHIYNEKQLSLISKTL